MHFNPYLKTILVSSDYAGAVNIWDVNDGSKVTTHLEHGKRVWSVMFNPTEPQLFASGSDDGTGILYVQCDCVLYTHSQLSSGSIIANTVFTLWTPKLTYVVYASIQPIDITSPMDLQVNPLTPHTPSHTRPLT